MYLAVHENIGQFAAIKEFLPTDLATREGDTVQPINSEAEAAYRHFLAGFLAEARRLVRLRHNHIVRCLDFIEANGTAYLVMDYEDGLSLADLMRQRESNGASPLDEEQIKHIILPILDGLKAAHAQDILYRDIKPDNIFVRRADEQPALIDFSNGICRTRPNSPGAKIPYLRFHTVVSLPYSSSIAVSNSLTSFPASFDANATIIPARNASQSANTTISLMALSV